MDLLAFFPQPSQPLPVLQHLVLGQLKVTGKLLSSFSTALTTLELHNCEVVDFDGVRKDKLGSLNLERSYVQLHRSYVTALTQLTFLGLAYSTWEEPHSDPLKVFHGWPRLQVLQCTRCNLFDHTTEVHVGPATRLQVTYIRPGMACSELSIADDNLHGDLIPQCRKYHQHRMCILPCQLAVVQHSNGCRSRLEFRVCGVP